MICFVKWKSNANNVYNYIDSCTFLKFTILKKSPVKLNSNGFCVHRNLKSNKVHKIWFDYKQLKNYLNEPYSGWHKLLGLNLIVYTEQNLRKEKLKRIIK